jgi:hypothetical protein
MGQMKRLLAVLFASVVLMGLGRGPAAASTFDLGTLTPGDTKGVVANFGTDQVLAELHQHVPGWRDQGYLANFQLDLFNESDPASSLGSFTDLSGTSLAFSYLNLAAGDYFFRVMGNTGPEGNIYRYRFVAGTEVPIPPALLLFATAVGGLGFIGYRRRKLAA